VGIIYGGARGKAGGARSAEGKSPLACAVSEMVARLTSVVMSHPGNTYEVFTPGSTEEWPSGPDMVGLTSCANERVSSLPRYIRLCIDWEKVKEKNSFRELPSCEQYVLSQSANSAECLIC
jgi:hypothetical protein